jgi:hypothetical protein
VPISKLAHHHAIDPPDTLHLPSIVRDLLSAGVLTNFQATWLADHWPDLPDDWSSHPLLRSTGEHTRAYIDRQRHLETSPSTFIEKELIPYA